MKKENKINAKELRIGNYVYTKEWVIKSYGIDGFVNIIKNIDNYRAIPLTEEWLVKFGFKFSGYNSNDKAIYKINDEIWILKNIVTKKFYLTEYYREVKHLHQLQNLYFALTGKELEI